MRIYTFLLTLFFTSVALAAENIPDIEINEIEPGVYLHKSYSQVEGWGLVSSNGLIVVEGKSAFIIDTPWSARDTEKLVRWVQSKNYTLLGSVSTHSHEDRTAGIKWLNKHSIATYATSLTNDILQKEGREQATHSMEGEAYTLADGLIEVFYPGGGHTIDNVVVWLPKSTLLFGGCFVRSHASKGLGYTGEAHIDQWAESAKKVMSKYPNAKVVVPGHGKIGNIELLTHTKQLAEKTVAKLNTDS